ncbi:DUF2167 domain-containing protein [Clostridium beijerinckii]|uniref:DUF2167 domain-containing protein n=1 Tax=Clostridium beijerinckii TaxID=1520 RepID=UPI00098C2C14|nr:DUF2167 domain-containing protein [Clostridium beijerinckii]NRT79719.1 putative membrane-anchored protein [Clostridium beijerinckii]OOM49499.1 hypothetical protein CBEIJ_11670 [Clostridium beijerinckii]
MLKSILRTLAALTIFTIIPVISYANDSTNASEINWIEGPKTVDVGTDLAKLDLPSEYVFANGKDAKELMKEMDNSVTGMEQGIVLSKDNNENWYVLFEFNNMGYVKDNDAGKINADQLLSDIKNGTEEDNKERMKNGKSTLDIIGWDEKPHYDPNTNNLVWSVLCNSSGEQIVNYNVRVLGRGGVTEVTLVASKDEMLAVKPKLENIIKNYAYKEGKRYSDYIKGDKVAEAGLAALIVGGTASKIGLFAKILIIFKKVWIFVLAVIGGLFGKVIKVFKKKPYRYDETELNSNKIVFKENSEADIKS